MLVPAHDPRTDTASSQPVLDLDRRTLLLPGSAPMPLRGREIPFRLLETLIRGSGEPIGKRELFEAAWKARYLGKCHDGRLHFHIGRLRAWLGALGDGARALQRRRDGYRLALPFLLRGNTEHSNERASLPSSPPAEEGLRAMLNRTGELTNRDYATQFGVSRSAAFRALRDWTRAGLLTRVGGGRAVRYALAGW